MASANTLCKQLLGVESAIQGRGGYAENAICWTERRNSAKKVSHEQKDFNLFHHNMGDGDWIHCTIYKSHL